MGMMFWLGVGMIVCAIVMAVCLVMIVAIHLINADVLGYFENRDDE